MKINLPFENETQEFKTSLAELDKGILSLGAMLNKRGKGTVYFGVANNGEVLGVELGEESIKKISSRVAEFIKPSIIPSISMVESGDKIAICLSAEGSNKPYSVNGDYRIRVGSENKKIEPALLRELFVSNSQGLMDSLESIEQNLKFTQLKGLFIAQHKSIDNLNFERNIGLLTQKGTYNYLAELLADANNCSIKVVRFRGNDKLNMVSRNEYGYQCLLVAMRNAFDYVVSFNETKVDLSKGMLRSEMQLFDTQCFDEAWTNACLHNRWVSNIPPAIYMFDNRIEIISSGGLPVDYTAEEFYSGISHPVNIGLQRIMGQLNIVEQTGHGNLAIIAKYGREAFEIAQNHIKVTIPFAFTPSNQSINYDGLSPLYIDILKVIKDKPLATIIDISKTVGLGKTRTSEIISDLKFKGRIERIGGSKGGYWKVL